jgi:hypothetical protein
LFLPLSCLSPELLGSRKTSSFYVCLVLKLTCLSPADIIRSVTSAWSLICLQTAVFPSTPPMAGQLPHILSVILFAFWFPAKLQTRARLQNI